MQSIIKFKSFDGLAVKDVDMASRTLVQAYTKYNVIDSDKDIGRKGMFTKTWSENFPRIKHILNHDATQSLGRPEKFYDDSDHAYIQSKIGTHTLGDDFIKMVDSGLITEASYGYNVIREQKGKDASGTEANELLEVKLWEVSSLTGWGANQYTPVISMTKGGKEDMITKMVKRAAALESFCKKSDATDETIQLLLLEIKHLQQSVIDLTTNSTPAAKAPEPQNGKSLDTAKILSFLEIKKLSLTN